ncbi:hypothetical protein PVK06_011164 [Gossypium arboreum]|uniref:Reverse transcriptase zinc-binding domain-containing protein n=1 Tax=Gossypium arboreum TaxID=29729 RepID=A0ABR0Q8K3_GOSAR|nr:hypothetical protein PVK06_011164 [Gossypium arboreum]
MLIPKGLCDEIEAMVRQFIWSSTNASKNIALVNWELICQTNAHSGLGVKALRDHNMSFIMKLGFKLVTDHSSLWVNVLWSKYGVQNRLLESLSMGRCSFLWRFLSKIWPLIRENLLWSVGNGRKINCWKDSWVPKVGPLSKKIVCTTNLDMDCPLSDMVTENGDWNLDFFRLWLSEDIIQKIVRIPPPQSNSGSDIIIWEETTSGAFTVKSTYNKLREDSWHIKEDVWKLPRKYIGPQRVKVFIWLILKHRLLTNVERIRRGLGSDTACGTCGHHYENILHVLRDCRTARKIWL